MNLNKLTFKTERIEVEQGGERECAALVANVKNLPDNVVEWWIDEYRFNSPIAEIYHFAKSDYEKILSEIYDAAYLEKAEVFAEQIKHSSKKCRPKIFRAV